MLKKPSQINSNRGFVYTDDLKLCYCALLHCLVSNPHLNGCEKVSNSNYLANKSLHLKKFPV